MMIVRRLLGLLFGPREPELEALSSKTYGDVQDVEFVSNHDGDTITVNIKGWPPVCGELISVRVLGIDTPEMTDRRSPIRSLAQQARAFTESKLKAAKRIDLKRVQRDKYFRLLAEVYVDNENLAQQLLKAGLAKPYDGGAKLPW